MSDDLILVAGEALVDLIPFRPTAEFSSSDAVMRATRNCAEPVLGGSPFNTAMGIGRLGAPCGFVGRISTDAFGDGMVDRLTSSHVDLHYVARDPRPSPLAFVTRGTEQTGARYAFYLGATAFDGPSPFPDEWPEGVVHVNIGSFSATEGQFGAAALAMLQRAGGHATSSYDPNIRPLVVGPPAATVPLVEERVKLATVVKASDEDMIWLYPNTDPATSAAAWARLGPRLVVLTRGGSGSVGFFGGGRVEWPAPRVTVADTVGAGDSFMAALITTMYEDGAIGRPAVGDSTPYTAAQVEGWLNFAGAAAAITCTRQGANPPTRDEMRQSQSTVSARAPTPSR